MNDLVKISSGKAMVSSKDVAGKFAKVHRNVIRDIEKLGCSPEFRALNFVPSLYTSSQNKVLPCYEITRDGFAFLCMGFTGKEAGKWKEKYISAFNSMEIELLRSPATMDDLNEIVKKMEANQATASDLGRGLQAYGNVKKKNAESFKKAVTQAQLSLKI